MSATKQKEFIPALGYNWLTGFYDLTIKLTMPEKKFRTRLIDELKPEDNELIMEFGFGTGQNLILAYQRNNSATFIGVDIDPKVRKIAERKMRRLDINIKLDLYEGLKFDYLDNTFDKVFSSLVFHQLKKEEKKNSLREIYRVLKPDGQLLIGDWGEAKSKKMRYAFYIVQLLDGFRTTNDNLKGLLPKYIKETGFRNVTETGFINTSIGTYCYYNAIK